MVRVRDLPSVPVADETTVYDVPGSSRAPAVHDRLSLVIFPVMLPAFELTATDVSVAFAAVTFTRWSTGTPVAPRATLVLITAAAAWSTGWVPWRAPPRATGFRHATTARAAAGQGQATAESDDDQRVAA